MGLNGLAGPVSQYQYFTPKLNVYQVRVGMRQLEQATPQPNPNWQPPIEQGLPKKINLGRGEMIDLQA